MAFWKFSSYLIENCFCISAVLGDTHFFYSGICDCQLCNDRQLDHRTSGFCDPFSHPVQCSVFFDCTIPAQAEIFHHAAADFDHRN